MLLTVLIVLLVIALLGGGYGASGERSWGWYGWSPFGLLLVLLLIGLLLHWF